LHLDYVSTNFGKRTVKHKVSKIWNQLHAFISESNKLGLEEFLHV